MNYALGFPVSHSVPVGRAERAKASSETDSLPPRLPRVFAIISILWSLFVGLIGVYIIIQGFGSCDALCLPSSGLFTPSQLATFQLAGIDLILTAVLLVAAGSFIIDPGTKEKPVASGRAKALVILMVLWSVGMLVVGYGIGFVMGFGANCFLPCSFVGTSPGPDEVQAWQEVGIFFVLTALQLTITSTFVLDPGRKSKPM